MATKKKASKVSKTQRTPANKGALAAPAARFPSSLLIAPKSASLGHAGTKAGLPKMSLEKRLAAANAMANKLNVQFKTNIVITADDATTNSYLRRPCGIMQLDIDTGGGLPAGEISTLSGPDGSGKTTLLYSYFAMHQRLYGNDSFCALGNTEGNIDYFQARRMGWIVPVPFKVIEAEQQARAERGAPLLTKEEVAELRYSIGQNFIIEGDSGEEILDATLELLRTNLYGIIGIDSYEGLIPRVELELDSLDDNARQAARASLMTRFIQKYGPIKRGKDHFTTLVMTCQVRSNRKKSEAQSHIAKYMKDWASTVPYMLRHGRQLDVTVWSGSKIYPKTARAADDEKKAAIGKHINWEIAKGKLNTHDNINGETSYYYDPRGFDLARTVIISGMRYGIVVEHEGSLTFLKNGEPDEYLRNINGVETFLQAMAEEPQSELDLRRAILAAAGKSCIYI